MLKDNQEKTQTVAYGWQLITPKDTIVTDNDQGNVVIANTSAQYTGAPPIMLRVSENAATIDSNSYFEQSVSITLDKKIIVKRRPDIELDD
ncbi:hypothetical protein [Leuconostoc suionicum]|uniref:hypothetical protein n=1 Tax=Leuconostoc suionicum TaxID=1511761 RepID=UPI0024ACA04F|nr:hypothetical protein [Leuconostoc suionicum]MDI6522875.1 hypothetical protein [Leuconostoc suionicum]